MSGHCRYGKQEGKIQELSFRRNPIARSRMS